MTSIAQAQRSSPGARTSQAHATAASVAGDALLHPAALAAVALLLLNDHILKAAYPGLITGKLSDVAGLTFFPLLLVGAWEVGQALVGRWRGPSRKAVSIAIAVSALAFSAAKTTMIGAAAAGSAFGLGWWVLGVPAALLGGHPIPAYVASVVTRDPTDLVALPAVLLAWWIGVRRARAAAPADGTFTTRGSTMRAHRPGADTTGSSCPSLGG